MNCMLLANLGTSASEVHKMKRILLILFVCLPSLALASSITYDTREGLLTGSNAGLVDRTSEVINATGITGDLGKIFFSTGKLISGSLEHGGTFAAGGSFTFVGNGFKGTHKGVDFTGTFSEPVTWTLMTLSNGEHDYTLTGELSGTLFNGQSVVGVLSETTLEGKGFYVGDGTLQDGTLTLSATTSVPEPSSTILLAIGLLGVGALLVKKAEWPTAHTTTL